VFNALSRNIRNCLLTLFILKHTLKIRSMNKFIFCVVLCLLCSITYSQDGPKKTLYPNGKVKETGLVKNGKKEGEWREFYESGKLQRVRFFINGQVDGVIRQYFESGKLKAIGSAKGGQPDGEIQEYYENGGIKMIINMNEGK